MYQKVRKTGILAIKLKENDYLRWVKFTTGNDNIFQVSAKGQSIFYREADIRPMGRTASGVRGIYLKGDDYAVSCDVIAAGREKEADALIIMEKGLGKRTPLSQFKMQLRGGMGIRAAQVKPRTGTIVGMRIVYGEDYDVILASSKGQMIRTALKTIKRLGRDTQGVTLIRLNPGDKVTSVTVISKDKTDKLADIPEDIVEPKIDDQKAAPTGGKKDNQADVKKASKKPPTPVGQEVEKKKLEENAQVEQPKTEKTESQIPDWAKVHTDTWRQPDIFKPRKEIKVHNYQNKKELPLKEPPKPPKNEEENYWGGRLK